MDSQLATLVVSGVPSITEDLVAGEDITASDNNGLCFLGKGEETVQSITSDSEISFGNAATSEKVRVVLDATTFTYETLRNITLSLKKVGSPADMLYVDFYATVDAAQENAPTDTRLTIDSSEIGGTSTVITKELVMSHVPDGATEFIVEISRSGALDGSNYYQWDIDSGATASISSDLYVSGVWTAQTGTFYHSLLLGFETGKAYLCDNRFPDMSDVEYLADQTVLEGNSGTFLVFGIKGQTSTLGDEFYLNVNPSTVAEESWATNDLSTILNRSDIDVIVTTSNKQGYYIKEV
jgi:hypothetical protein